MDYCLVKSGACSVVLGRGHYKDFFPDKKGKLIKLTKTTSNHNEFKYLSAVRNITKYRDYYAIPDELSVLIKPSDKFYEHAKKLSQDKSMFYGSLNCMYIDYAGEKDLLGTMEDVINGDYTFWKSYKTILGFTKNILQSLKYLHDNKICHLDIKPENIMVNFRTKKFKLIDFGFASVEPFKDYINDLKGTPGYFPRKFPNEEPSEWLPEINANDIHPIDGLIPMQRNSRLVYKIDSYCFGRVLYFLKYVYETYTPVKWINSKKTKDKLDAIIKSLTQNNVYARMTIQECLRIFI